MFSQRPASSYASRISPTAASTPATIAESVRRCVQTSAHDSIVLVFGSKYLGGLADRQSASQSENWTCASTVLPGAEPEAAAAGPSTGACSGSCTDSEMVMLCRLATCAVPASRQSVSVLTEGHVDEERDGRVVLPRDARHLARED